MFVLMGSNMFWRPLSQVQRPLFVLISKCGMARVREELKALDSVMILMVAKTHDENVTILTAVPMSMLIRLQFIHLAGASCHQHGFARRGPLACAWV